MHAGIHLPPRKQTPAYGLREAGTHPTGMHSCFELVFVHVVEEVLSLNLFT